MSDGIVRICNLHGHELRTIGSTLVCPQGHDCPVDWTVKALPYSDPRIRRCPIHGKPLIGAGDILECEQYDHQVSTLPRDRPRTEAPVNTTPKPGDRSPLSQPPVVETVELKPKRAKAGTERPHGTPGRYWRGCRCQPCKTAVNEHVKTLKLRREGKDAKAAPPRTEVLPRATKPAPVQKSARVQKKAKKSAEAPTVRLVESAAVPVTAIGAIAARIAGLRAEIADAEISLAREVNGVLSDWKLVQVAGVKA